MKALRLFAPLLLAVLAAGCASTNPVGKAVRKTLEATGLAEAKPQAPPEIPLRLFAGGNLNSGTDGRASAVIVKIYHLRSLQRFEQAPLTSFLDAAGEQAALGADLLSSTEVVLTPGGRQQLQEKMSEGATVLGVVALFRAPAEGRWRFAFDTTRADAARDGVTVGIHACALSTDSAALLTRVVGDAGSLASVRCQAPRRDSR